MPAPLTLHLIRHGEVHNPEHIFYGRLAGYYLSEAGRKQAEAAGLKLATEPLSALYSSPMERAQETAGIIASRQAQPLKPVIDESLNEVYSPYDGRPHAELEPTLFDIYTGTGPEYEKPEDVRARLLRFIQAARQRHAGQTIAAVAHGDIMVVAFLYAKAQPAHDIARTRLEQLGLPERYPMTASISTLIYQSDDPDEVPAYRYLRPY